MIVFFTSLLTISMMINKQASSSAVQRSIYDPYVICTNPFAVPSTPPGLPTFDNYLELCSVVHGIPGFNMGCYCDHPYGTVHCEESMGEPKLWAAASVIVEPQSGQHLLVTLFDLCLHVCYCSSAAKGKASRNETSKQQNAHKNQPHMNGYTNGNGVSEDDDTTPISSSLDSQQDTETTTQNSPVMDPNQAACGSTCSTAADCQSSRSGCTCKTQKESYIAGEGTVRFVAACMVSLGGKREEDRPCPCNSTYVSHACCGAENGILWEEASLKLGELLNHEE